MFLSLPQRFFRFQFRRLSSLIDTGIVKRFSKEKGFGFVKRDSNGNDIFVHFQSILGTGFQTLEVGQQVEFKVFEGIKGLEARDVNIKNQILDQIKETKVLNHDRHIGVIRKFTKNRGFGFITRKSDGADFFVHSRSIRNGNSELLTEGMEVEFREVQNDRGAEAKDVRILDFEMTENEVDKIEIGIIQRWNKDRGFGFVRRLVNGNDLFVHASSFKTNLRELKIGQKIQFRIHLTPKGTEATDVYLIENEEKESTAEKTNLH